MYPSYMLPLSREKIYEGLRLKPITYTYVFDKGFGPRLFIAKQLKEVSYSTLCRLLKTNYMHMDGCGTGIGLVLYQTQQEGLDSDILC